jgi:hypothetical protein
VMNTPFFICVPKTRGAYFRMERTRSGLRQIDIAAIANIPQSYVSLAERDLYIPNWALDLLEKTLNYKNISENGDA